MQEKRFALGKFVALIIFCVCLMSLSVGIVFAYVPTLSFKSEIAPVLSSCSLSHQGKVLYNTAGDINSVVGTTDSATDKTYIVKPISANTVQVKCDYSVIKTNNTFTSSGSAVISDVWAYGVKLTSGTHYSVSGLTISFVSNITSVIEDTDEVILNFQFS